LLLLLQRLAQGIADVPGK
jgi:hypothetical protein